MLRTGPKRFHHRFTRSARRSSYSLSYRFSVKQRLGIDHRNERLASPRCAALLRRRKHGSVRAGHVSFASAHEGKKPLDTHVLNGKEEMLWPDHCVRWIPRYRLLMMVESF